MPSIRLTNESGGQLLISGNLFSGQLRPQGGVQFRADRVNSGSIYISLSGGTTVQSGGYSGALDGMQLGPGDAYWVPAIGFNNGKSGTLSVYAATDAVASGFARVYYEVF